MNDGYFKSSDLGRNFESTNKNLHLLVSYELEIIKKALNNFKNLSSNQQCLMTLLVRVNVLSRKILMSEIWLLFGRCRIQLFCNPMGCNPPGSSAHGFPRREPCSGLPFPSPNELNKKRQIHNDFAKEL